MTKRDHTSTVQSLLRGQGLHIADSDIYGGPLDEGMSDDVITMTESGGPGPDNALGTTESIQRPHVQVSIRNADKTKAKSDADDVWHLLHEWDGGSDYSRPDMLQSTPLHVPGTDSDGRHVYTVNVELFICE